MAKCMTTLDEIYIAFTFTFTLSVFFLRCMVSQFSKMLRNIIFAFDCTSCASPGVSMVTFQLK